MIACLIASARQFCARLLALLVFVVLLGVGCGEDSPTEAVAGIVGAYTLLTVNDETLPAVVGEDPPGVEKQEITGGWLSLRADRTWTMNIDFRTTYINGSVDTHQMGREGTFTRSDDAITFSTATESYSSSVSGTTLSFNDPLGQFGFRR